uniref:Uncharacterized protein n=3 Tax=Cuerna arida TaxID=1464854 RepID=A0A1B6ETY6_9HEMI
MAVKFCLKFDPRIQADRKGELFFCLKGQNAYVASLSQTAQNEIKERLEEDTYKTVWNQTFQDLNAETQPSSPTLDTVNIGSGKRISSLESFKGIHELHETDSPKTKAKKLKDSEIKNKEETFKTPKNNSNQIKLSTGKNTEPHECNKQDVEGSTNQFKINSTVSSDETVLGETPPLLRELREIMHEESVLGMQLTSTEDIHLKNTGSEITYSQFRIGADEKTLNFRTSTQLDSISQVVVPSNCEEVTQTEECSKMEPLVYCPSGSSLCSGLEVSPLKDKTVTEDPKCQEECSESILHNYNAGQNLDVEVNKTHLKTGIETINEKKIINDKNSDISGSSSIRIISSNSSELECEIVHHKRLQKDQNVGLDNERSEPQLDSPNMQICQSFGRNEQYVPEQIEVVDNSSNDSLFSVVNSTTIKQRSSCNISVNQFNSSPFVHNVELNHSNRVVKNILPSCYFKSSLKPNLIEEDATNIVDENDSIKYLSYSRDQSLPFLNLSLLNKLIYQNYLKVAVFIVNITPPLTGSWQEKCVKARCPNCDKLFDVYNAANNKYSENTSSAALSVGSHIVCPDSKCCNQILGNPEFQISVEIKLKDGTPLSALIGAQHAEEVLGCTAQEAITDKEKFDKVAEILKKLESKISNDHMTHVHLTRKNVCDPKSGPLYIQKIYI